MDSLVDGNKRANPFADSAEDSLVCGARPRKESPAEKSKAISVYSDPKEIAIVEEMFRDLVRNSNIFIIH
jgi:hypothetical protein